MMQTHELLTRAFPNGGYYVEAGAHNGIGDSQTKALEDMGWQGLCIEPSLAFKGLSMSRKCELDNRALWNADGQTVQFLEVPHNSELSGIASCFKDHHQRSGDLIDVQTVTLTTVLREHNAPAVIEFLSLDTDGSEPVILAAHDFNAYRFLVVVVEHNGVGVNKLALNKLMFANDYVSAPHTRPDIECRYIDKELCRQFFPSW